MGLLVLLQSSARAQQASRTLSSLPDPSTLSLLPLQKQPPPKSPVHIQRKSLTIFSLQISFRALQARFSPSMASSLALRRLLPSTLLPKSSSAFPSIPAARLFTTNATRRYDSDDSDETDVDSYRRPLPLRRNDFFSDVFAPSPFSAGRNLSQVLNLVDQISENPFLSATRRGWDARETEDGLHLRFDMPGLGKEDVKVSVEKDILVIRGEGGHVEGEEEPRRYSTGIQLPEKVFKTDGVKAEMKNGVLKVVVPKIKEEERSDVFHVRVE